MVNAANQTVGMTIRPKVDCDKWIMRAFMCVIGLYLLITTAFPLWAILSKSVETYTFDLAHLEFQVNEGAGWGKPLNALKLGKSLEIISRHKQATTFLERISATRFFPDFSSQPQTRYRIRNTIETKGGFTVSGDRVIDTGWVELSSEQFRYVNICPVPGLGFGNFLSYISNPAHFSSLFHSLYVATVSTFITVILAFVFAYALTRSCMRFKSAFKTIAFVPILVPSMLGGISLIYLFGKQSLIIKVAQSIFGAENIAWMLPMVATGAYGPTAIYGPIGIIVSEVFFTFPHALVIITTALSIADARLYEAAVALRTPKLRILRTVTIPGARYGLISAAFVVFNLVITDFGVPKVIGGQYNVLAVAIYKQVIGQQNFQMGAVVSVVLIIPALIAFIVDRIIQKKQVALLTARAVPYEPKPNRAFDGAMTVYCGFIAFFILGLIVICQYAALIKFWPYNLSLSFQNYNFKASWGGGWATYWNSLKMAFSVDVIGTITVFIGAYMVEKGRGFQMGRAGFQFFAMMPMAIPGLVLGLGYIFFFNNPINPLGFIYGTLGILVICTITHYYTVSHLTAVTALKQMDREFEDVSQSLKQPFYKLFARVTMPVCLPAILDISVYFFVNAMCSVSAVVFLYSPDTMLASVAMLAMDDAGDISFAAAMGTVIFYTNVCVRGLHSLVTRKVYRITQAWRKR